MDGEKSISLVLGSGAARGLTQIGIIEELEARGYSIDSIAGTSVGSLLGGVYAAGALSDFKEYICNMKRNDFIKILDFTLNNGGSIKGDKIFQTIAKHVVSDINIEDLPIPYRAVAVDINSNREHVFSSGSLFTAMRSSISIPGVFTPVELDGMKLVDGALLSPLPIEHLVKVEGSKIIAVSLNGVPQECNVTLIPKEGELIESDSFKDRLVKREKGTHFWERDLFNINLFTSSFELMNHKIAELTLDKYHTDMVIDIPYSLCELYQFFYAERLIETGRELAKREFDKAGY